MCRSNARFETSFGTDVYGLPTVVIFLNLQVALDLTAFIAVSVIVKCP